MKAYRCDRCGKYYEDNGCSRKYYVTTLKFTTGCVKDLCPECQAGLNDFMGAYCSNDSSEDKAKGESSEDKKDCITCIGSEDKDYEQSFCHDCIKGIQNHYKEICTDEID